MSPERVSMDKLVSSMANSVSAIFWDYEDSVSCKAVLAASMSSVDTLVLFTDLSAF